MQGRPDLALAKEAIMPRASEEIELDLISQCTTEAFRFKKAQGFKLGRPEGPGKSNLDAFA